MFNTKELTKDIGSVLVGRQAVEAGIIDRMGGIHTAMNCLYDLINAKKNSKIEQYEHLNWHKYTRVAVCKWMRTAIREIVLGKCLSWSENEGKEKECIPWQRETTVHIIKVHNQIREVNRLPVVRHQRQGHRRNQDLRRRLDRRPHPVQGAERRKHSLHRNRHVRTKFICSSIWQYVHFSSSVILAGVGL